MSTKIAIHEGARATPVGVGLTALFGADLATQVSVAVGVLTCIYLFLQMWLIVRRLRSERRKSEMLEERHRNSLDLHEREMARMGGEELEG